VVLYDGTNVFSGSKGGLGDKYSNGVNQRVELVFTAKSAATSVGNRFISDKSGNWQVFGMSNFQVFDITEEDNQEKAREAVNSLFTNKDPNGTITETVTQAEIDAAQALINNVTDPAKKAALQADLNKAQSQLDANQYNAIQKELGNLVENPAFELTESSTAVDKWGLYRNNVAVSNASTSITLQQSVDTDGNIPTTNESIKMKNGAQAGELQGYIKDDNMLIMGQTLKTIANHKYRLTANHTGKSAVVLYDGTNVFSGSKGGLGDKYSNGVNQRVELVFTAKSAATSVGNRFISDKSGNWQVFGMSDFQVFDITEEDNQEKAREAVNSLFTNKDPNGTITETVTQAEIDAA
ncbi:toxin Cry1Ac domain D-VI-related protein, partial [Listeria rocourtiae]|uniref:toxin Cry1Ac domain D-VI-related protein n=1 Tax=Listeria rocourtiae TaxID=647910 RepID=UPI0003E891FA